MSREQTSKREQFLFSPFSPELGRRFLLKLQSILIVQNINLYTPVADDKLVQDHIKEKYAKRIANPMSFKIIEQNIRQQRYVINFDLFHDFKLVAQNVVEFNPSMESLKSQILDIAYDIYPELLKSFDIHIRTQEQLATISSFLCQCSEAEFKELFDQDTDISKFDFPRYISLYRRAVQYFKELEKRNSESPKPKSGGELFVADIYDDIRIDLSELEKTTIVIQVEKSEISEVEMGLGKEVRVEAKPVRQMTPAEIRLVLKRIQKKE